MSIKWDINKLKEFYNSHDCILISKEYKNEDTYLTYICKCGNQDTKKFSAFKRSSKCKDCYKINMSKKMAFSFQEVKEYFESKDCILLSKAYINAWQYLDYICVCGTKSIIQFANFKKGVRCKGCLNKRKYISENLRQIAEEYRCVYISQTGTDKDSKVKFICHCGRESEKSIEYFIKTKKCNYCSHESFIEKVSGENNVNWNPNLSDEEREKNRDFPEYEQWRKLVFERDNYTCQCCGKIGDKLNAHHKDGYHWCEERRLDADNGITLCEECHDNFHREYGIKNNTEEQFHEFMLNIICLTN